MLANILLIFFLIACNAFFVSVEFAVVSSRKVRIKIIADEGNPAAQLVLSWLEDHAARDKLIAASQLGITMISMALGAVGENTFEALLAPFFQVTFPEGWEWLYSLSDAFPLVLALIIVTGLDVVLGELTPKVATLYAPEKVAILTARPMHVFATVFKWAVAGLDGASRIVLGLFGLKIVSGHSISLSVNELRQVLSESEQTGVIEKPEREMLDAIFDLKDLVVRQVIMPRTEIIALEADSTFEEISVFITSHPYTKYPVYEDNLDQIIGILHVKDLLYRVGDPNSKQLTARDLAREAIFIPDSIPISGLLREMRIKRQHMAIVLDEFGGTAGLVTLEDLIEEIVGEVSDPFDTIVPEMQIMPDGSVKIDGLALIEEVNKELGLNLQDEDYDTIAGYMLGKMGYIPNVYDAIETDGIRLEVLSMDGRRIERIQLRRMDPQSAS